MTESISSSLSGLRSPPLLFAVVALFTAGYFLGTFAAQPAAVQQQAEHRSQTRVPSAPALTPCPPAATPTIHRNVVAPAQGCSQSLKDTYGFICDSDENWARRKAVMLQQAGRVLFTTEALRSPSHYFQANFEPSLSCATERRIGECFACMQAKLSQSWPITLGEAGDGGKWVCDPYRIPELYTNSSKTCIIMSIGSNNQFDFEESVHETFGSLCHIHTFDHTVANPHPPPYVNYHSLGIAPTHGEKVRTLAELVELATAGHSLAHVEILKIDVEGRKSCLLRSQCFRHHPFSRR